VVVQEDCAELGQPFGRAPELREDGVAVGPA
jgi:hypothetical protein